MLFHVGLPRACRQTSYKPTPFQRRRSRRQNMYFPNCHKDTYFPGFYLDTYYVYVFGIVLMGSMCEIRHGIVLEGSTELSKSSWLGEQSARKM